VVIIDAILHLGLASILPFWRWNCAVLSRFVIMVEKLLKVNSSEVSSPHLYCGLRS
jgi:hypothetical protein